MLQLAGEQVRLGEVGPRRADGARVALALLLLYRLPERPLGLREVAAPRSAF
ncbi:hypothetical protein WME91_03040 [Sorangium sp. So ce269]